MKIVLWILGGIVTLVVLAGCAALVASRNVEQPPYASVALDGDFELRDYPALTVAEVTAAGGQCGLRATGRVYLCQGAHGREDRDDRAGDADGGFRR